MKILSSCVLIVTLFMARHTAAADSVATDSAATGYAAAIRADKPALYWRFETISGDVVRDESRHIDIHGQLKAMGPGRRGISGLAASFTRSHLAGRVEAQLNPQQDAAVERDRKSTRLNSSHW